MSGDRPRNAAKSFIVSAGVTLFWVFGNANLRIDHVFGHAPAAMGSWPGLIIGMLGCLEWSVANTPHLKTGRPIALSVGYPCRRSRILPQRAF